MAGNIRVPAKPGGLSLRIEELDANTVVMTLQNQVMTVEDWEVGEVIMLEPAARHSDGSRTEMVPLELLRTPDGFLVRKDGRWVRPDG